MRFLVSLAALALVGQSATARVMHDGPATAVSHQRLLPLQGGRNFRDLGGYRTTDGRTVKWGLLFRSGSMHGLTPFDYAYLEKRGLRVICDFRSSEEREAEPVNWPAMRAPTVFSDDYGMVQKGLLPPDLGNATPEQARRAMATMYPRMLEAFNDQYRRMFRELLAGHAPLAFNCSAGKDRTGVAAALLLTALGVPRATVVQDYTLTNRYLDARQLLAKSSKATANQPWMKLPSDALKAMVAADPSYIEAALSVLDEHPGGAEGYFRDEMGLSHADLVKLQQMYLQ